MQHVHAIGQTHTVQPCTRKDLALAHQSYALTQHRLVVLSDAAHEQRLEDLRQPHVGITAYACAYTRVLILDKQFSPCTH